MGIDISKTKSYLHFYKILRNVGARRFGRLRAIECACHTAETKLRCARSSRICMLSPF